MEAVPSAWKHELALSFVGRHLRRLGLHPGASWSLSWVALFAGGMVIAGPHQASGPWLAAFLVAALFPAFTVVGALGFAGRATPLWWVPAVLVLGALRAALWAGAGPAASHALALLYEPVAPLVAAAIVLRAPLLRDDRVLRHALVVALVAVAGLEIADSATILAGARHPLVAPLWYAVGPATAFLEILAMWPWIARRELRIEHAEGSQRTLEDEIRRREHTEALLRRKEAWLYDFLEQAPDMLVALRPGSWEILRCNRKFCETLGYPRRRLVGRSLLDFADPAGAGALRQRLSGLTARGYRRDLLLRLQRRDGNLFDVLANLAVRPDPAGGLPQVRAVLHNASYLERAAPALPEGDGLYRLLATHAPVGVFQADAQGRCRFANPRLCEILGLSPREAREAGWLAGVHPEDRGRVAREWAAAARTGGAFRARHRVRAHGSRVLTEILPAPGHDAVYVGSVSLLDDRAPRRALRAPPPDAATT